jgi:predicted phage terminase large subunit-like protein
MNNPTDLLGEVEKRTKRLDAMLPPPPARRRKVRAQPQPGPQTLFLDLRGQVDIRIYGGAAGGGKTWGLLVDPLDDMDVQGFGAVIFRRTYPQITNEGGPWDESLAIYPFFDAKASYGTLEWTFPNKNSISFHHLQYNQTVLDWLGAQVPCILWDQLETFTEYQFFYMLSRNRSTCGVKPRMAATVNPDADSWVRDLIAWWINEETGYPIEERAGVIRWFVRMNGELVWGDTYEELMEAHGDPELPWDHPKQPIAPKSLTFIPAKLEDNPALTEKDPGYRANLLAQGEVEKERLLGGNWNIRPEAGKIFNRDWFEIVDPESIPPAQIEVRRYDFAATEKKLKTTEKKDPDFTASCKMRYAKGKFWIMDATAEQQPPQQTDIDMVDNAKRDGARCKIRWEIEPGASALRDTARLIKMLKGFDRAGVRSTGDKYLRSSDLQSASRAGLVKLCRGAWNKRWLHHMHHQPDLPHDDEHDAAGGAHNDLLALIGEDEYYPASRSHTSIKSGKRSRKPQRRRR